MSSSDRNVMCTGSGVVVISVIEWNTHEHPHPSVLTCHM